MNVYLLLSQFFTLKSASTILKSILQSKFKIKSIFSQLLIAVLAVLILLSPCKLRNFIQAELGFPQTKVANKSKSTITNTSCHSFEAGDGIQIQANMDFVQSLLPNLNRNISSYNINLLGKSNASLKVANFSSTAVPFYILYQNFLIYL